MPLLARKRGWTLDSWWTTGLGTFGTLRRWTLWKADQARKISPGKRLSYAFLPLRWKEASRKHPQAYKNTLL